MTKNASWDELISLVEQAILRAENPGLLDAMREFRLLYVEDKQAVLDRSERIRLLKSSDVKGIDAALSELPPERKLLSTQEIAVEVAESLARMMIDLPAAFSSISTNIETDARIIWYDESSSTATDLEQIQLLSQISRDDQLRLAAQRVLDVIERGRVEGWQL